MSKDKLSRRSFLSASATLLGSLPFLSWSPRAWAGLAPMGFWKRKTLTAATIAEAIDFDGVNDYLSRSSEFTGNTSSNKFTFSAWVWCDENSTNNNVIYRNGNNRFFVTLRSNGDLQIEGTTGAGGVTLKLGLNPIATGLARNTWNHLLVSVDLTNSSNSHIYLNDSLFSPSWNIYTNGLIQFASGSHGVGGDSAGGYNRCKARLAHVFLDYTYRDLSDSANRRLFITAGRKPAAKAGLAALNPILYLPMDDPTNAHVNLGTGGNFTANGVFARSGRGPNQYNAPYSDLDGSADYLSRNSALTGWTPGKQFTFHCCFTADQQMTPGYILEAANGIQSRMSIYRDASNDLYFVLADDAYVERCRAVIPSGTFTFGRSYILTISVDLSSTSKRHIYVNGQSIAATWTAYSPTNLDFSGASTWRVGLRGTAIDGYWNGKLGDIWFGQSYFDLSMTANLAKFVSGTGINAKPGDLGTNGELPTGSAPIIFLPMHPQSAGKNYGTGGDFTVNSGPFTGARGPSEFNKNKATYDGTTAFLSRTTPLTGIVNGNKFSCSFWHARSGGSGWYIVTIKSGLADSLYVYFNNSGILRLVGSNTSGTRVLEGESTLAINNGWVQLCVDLSNPVNRHVFVNNTEVAMTWATYSNQNIKFTEDRQAVGADISGTNPYPSFAGSLAEVFFTTEYIDFSQEENRLKFRDAYGYPVDLGTDGSNPTGTAPVIYMRFDPSNFGKNSGSGGDFTVSGTMTDGGQL